MVSHCNVLQPDAGRRYQRCSVDGMAGGAAVTVTMEADFPAAMRDLDQWVGYKIILKEGADKPTKVPYSPLGDYEASSTEPKTWSTFETACAAVDAFGYDGKGFVFTKHDPYAGIDFDNCVVDGVIKPEIWAWVQRLDSYAEYSPSGTGVHVVIIGTMPGGKGRKNSERGIEMYDRGRYFTVTGKHIEGTPSTANERQSQLDALLAEFFPTKKSSTQSTQPPPAEIPADDRELLERMFASASGEKIRRLWHGDMSAYPGKDGKPDHSGADQALCNFLAFWTGNDAARMDRLFRQSKLYREKWNRQDYRDRTINEAIAATSEVYKGTRKTVEIADPPPNSATYVNGNGAGPHPAEQASEKIGKSKAIRLALASMGKSFRLNLVRERIEHTDGTTLHDGEQATIIADLFDRGLTNKALMQDVILAEAWEHRYDPLHDFLDSLKWDGQDHIRKLSYYFEDVHLVIDYPDGRKSTVLAAWLRRWLIGAAGKIVARVQNPMLVLASDQGLGKSEFARWLCSPLPDYFVESAINPESVDHQRWAAGNFIWEVGELGATTRKADVEALKAFITRHEHSFRVPYAKNEVHKAARTSFIGTVNPDNAGFLTDPTGNRRFLTVEVSAINWKGYLADVDVLQVWAQAYALYRQDNDAWKLDETETAVRDSINGEFNIDDPVRDAILSLFDVTPNATKEDGLPFTSSADLVFHVGTQVKAVSTKSLQMDVSRAMKRLNVTKAKNNNVNGYFGVSKRVSSNLPPTYED